MMGTTRARVVKQYPEDKLGLVYTVTSRHMIINEIKEGSVMAESKCLRPGQEIISITVGYGQRIPVEGLDRESVKHILRSIVSFAIIEARDPITTYSQYSISANVTKPVPNSKLGIVYSVTSRGVVIENIKNDGLLASTDLRPGYEIESINDTDMLGLDQEEVTAIFRSITSEINIKAKIPIAFHAIFGISTKVVGGDTPPRATCKMLCQRSVVPSILKVAGVPEASWKIIYDAISNEMIPTTKRAVELDATFKKEMDTFISKQMYVASDYRESHREKRAYQMLHQSSVCNNTATIAATNVLAETNFLLNSYGIYAKLEVHREDLPKFSNKKQDGKIYSSYPCGIRFIRPESGQHTLSSSVHVPLATVSAVPVVPSAPCYEMD
mmetsp:Transcript_23944/g.68809  ORF Transcript_23944/g.68809 Transcript_23944/m.68809 type:complete len:383 (+) Transcript_23944:69-1217(+)